MNAFPGLVPDDVRDLMRLLGDVRACSSSQEQGKALADGLAMLVGADVAWYVELVKNGRAWTPINFGTGSNVDGPLLGYLQQWGSEYPVDFDMLAASILVDERPSFAKHYQDISRQFAIHEYSECRDFIRTLRITDMVNPIFSLRPGHMFSFNIQRIGKQRLLGEREVSLIALAASEMRWMAETGRLKASIFNGGARRPDLPPRLQHVLTHLLDGSSPKKIAEVLGISVWTVRDHIARLYDHFGVHTREELSAKFIR